MDFQFSPLCCLWAMKVCLLSRMALARGCLRGTLSLIEQWGSCPLPFKVDKQLVVSEGVVLESSFAVDFFV